MKPFSIALFILFIGFTSYVQGQGAAQASMMNEVISIRKKEGIEFKKNKFVDAKKVVHIFIDQFGNSIYSVMPQGIPYELYKVHVIYQDDPNNPDYTYAVNQKNGSISSSIFVENSDAGSFDPMKKADGTLKAAGTLKWTSTSTFLRPSNKDNIEFDITRTIASKGTKTTIGSFSIVMAPSYHATINVGLYNSRLENPEFTYVTFEDGTGTVKKSLGGDNGVITATATLYASPIIILEALFEPKNNKEKKEYLKRRAFSRCYVDDHGLLERFYPTVGVKLGDDGFKNLFVGVNWEFARGASIFMGGHYGKVNYFDGDFEFGTETITEAQFNLRKLDRWDWNFAYGLNLDLNIVSGLFNRASN